MPYDLAGLKSRELSGYLAPRLNRKLSARKSEPVNYLDAAPIVPPVFKLE